MSTSMEGFVIFILCSSTFFCVLMGSTAAVDTITANQTIRDGDTIVSAAGNFELGFFSPGSSRNRYLGIWYRNVSAGTIVWVANRDFPLAANSSGVLRFDSQRILVLLNSSDGIIWSPNSTKSATNPIAQLLDNGNLVLRDGSDTNFLWQSFDYPGNTFLPGVKLGRDLVTGLDWHLSCWKSADDPSPGDYTIWLDLNGYPQIFMREGSNVTYRSGPWNGIGFSGMASLRENQIYKIELVRNEKEIYYMYELVNMSAVTRMVLFSSGVFQRFTWIDRIHEWLLYTTAQADNCDRYALCGAYGSCNINNSPPCECLKGFKPKFQEEWDAGDWYNGCVRMTQVDCGNGDGFERYSGLKLPDTRKSWFNESINLEECRRLCLRNCSCTAYANTDIRGDGSGCLLWFDELIDIREFSDSEQDLYVRMAASDLETNNSSALRKRGRIVATPILVIALLGMILILYVLRRRKLKREAFKLNEERDYMGENGEKDLELPLFGFEEIANATNNFSIDNKLGEGGFGPVYKGVLEGGKEIAVKRLSKDSRQGIDEFKNEVLCIAKLQHRNLVKLLGCCIKEEERMLIYEYMPNKSMDSFIFDKKQGMFLDWQQRYNIIKGIARGLLYLHHDSRLRIIHRDLKASNVLLDFNMIPKISDFGMARCLGGDENEAKKTTRVVGTYGYMPPEYAIDGFFSVKSDVFSFGVLVLEIVSGKRNRGFCHTDHDLNLLGHAWRLYKEGKPAELIDSSIVDSSCNVPEAFRSILIGLLCVQKSPEDRPSMSSVVLMLGSEIELPQPKHPAFFTERKCPEANSSPSKTHSHSVNKLTVTFLAPR